MGSNQIEENRMTRKTIPGLVLAAILAYATSSVGKPMPSPQKEHAYNSSHIAVCEYVGYKHDQKQTPDYFSGPIAQYKVQQILQGELLSTMVEVKYDFHDRSPCLAPPNWAFSKDRMPEIGSKWILFLTRQPKSKTFETYRGNFGRWEATDPIVLETKKALRVLNQGKISK